MAEISWESYLVARKLSPRFIGSIHGTHIEPNIIFRSYSGHILSGPQTFDILQHKGKYVLVHSYRPNLNNGLLQTRQRQRDQNEVQIKSLQRQLEYLNKDYVDLKCEVRSLKRKLDDILCSKRS